MKKFVVEELPDAVSKLYGKMKGIERFLEKNKTYLSKRNSSFNALAKEKCSSNFNKSDLAQLFYILMDEKILFFDDRNQKCNRSKIQFFIENNFTYIGDSGFQTNIDTISKQFSESKGFTYKEKQIRFLDNIIDLLEKRREKLICW
ncbi:hypothetical protein SGQ83_04675 [Flavobacterium sp. Fl-318]|uniref:Uncharacterized protein n=1 Tax=Flavobacterium cupriresistens TaxID=2893885 RepID=A0ABU4R8R1_9FLAO|nr:MULTISPECIES: hypothetical protein [unclassified Flavobacterium]MDX6188636.1 hypothetical protein [Flavobacterium sp. Fl-318]UFH44698.1 hypothetical protein LNP23_10975 [Flavobacterium sp. F-323]